MRNRIKFFLLAIMLCVAGNIFSQNYIGMKKEAIIENMKISQKNFNLNTGVVNPHYKYLKYEDKINEMTLLFFLSEDDVCTMTRQMCDYSNINDLEDKLNASYKKEGRNSWSYTENDKDYTVTMVEEDWFFTITTKLKD